MKARPAAIAFIFVTVMLDMVALGLIAPVLPNLILSFVNNDMARTAIWNGIFLTVFAAMQFFFSPVIGVLSDRFGRRPVLLLSSLGLGLDYVVMALAPTLGWLFVGRLISGITSSTVPTAFAYIADVTPKKNGPAPSGSSALRLGLDLLWVLSSEGLSAIAIREWHFGWQRL
jgi:Arabinose efflux permease